MKKILIISLTACFIITGMMIVAPRPLQSATLGVGVAGWYTWWDPRPESRESDADSDFLFSPQLLLQFSPSYRYHRCSSMAHLSITIIAIKERQRWTSPVMIPTRP